MRYKSPRIEIKRLVVSKKEPREVSFHIKSDFNQLV